jgi:hypothetical protein
LIGKARYAVMYCPAINCNQTVENRQLGIIVDDTRSTTFPKCNWLRTLQCPNCKVKWAVCVECPRVRSHFLKSSNVSRHDNSHHRPTSVIANNLRNVRAKIILTSHHGIDGVGADDNNDVTTDESGAIFDAETSETT